MKDKKRKKRVRKPRGERGKESLGHVEVTVKADNDVAGEGDGAIVEQDAMEILRRQNKLEIELFRKRGWNFRRIKRMEGSLKN